MKAGGGEGGHLERAWTSASSVESCACLRMLAGPADGQMRARG